jgi:hypothetical protein
VTFTDDGLEVSGHLTSVKSIDRLIQALEAGKKLIEMIEPDEGDEAAN